MAFINGRTYADQSWNWEFISSSLDEGRGRVGDTMRVAQTNEPGFRLHELLLVRLIVAGVWYGVAVGVVMSAFFIYFSELSSRFDLKGFLTFVSVPAAIAVVFGAVMGAGTLEDSDPVPALLAMIRGAIITTGCFAVCAVVLVLRATVESGKVEVAEFVWVLLLMMVYGGAVVGLPIAILVGAAAGAILYWVSRPKAA